ncbi:MAG TPA: hypothetical protein VFQ39_01515 [Longimicrobium sp.]|nr:hypothetical protein [Longimicrobium sp.]
MLEEIHATPEDRRKLEVITALGAVGAGIYAMADALASGWTGGAALGAVMVAAGAAALGWMRFRHRTA